MVVLPMVASLRRQQQKKEVDALPLCPALILAAGCSVLLPFSLHGGLYEAVASGAIASKSFREM